MLVFPLSPSLPFLGVTALKNKDFRKGNLMLKQFTKAG